MVFTPNTVAIVVVHFLDAPVPKGQFAHPVDTSSDASSGQAQVTIAGRRVETVRREVVGTGVYIPAPVTTISPLVS